MTKITFGIATKVVSKNRYNFLKDCVDSILKQTDDRFEIIISDDKSSYDVDWSQFKKHEKIKVFHQKETLGIFENFNFCLFQSKTDWFIPMGDDDLVDMKFVETILRKANDFKDVELFYFNHYNINRNGIVFKETKTLLSEGYYYYDYFDKTKYDKLLWSSPSSFFSVVNTYKLKKKGGFPNYGMTTDGYIAFLYFIEFKGYFIDSYIASLRSHSENASGWNNVVEFMNERINLIQLIKKDFKDSISIQLGLFLDKEIENIKYSHINLMKRFQDEGRKEAFCFFILCIKKRRMSFKLLIISIIGLILGKNIQKGFNFLSFISDFCTFHIRKICFITNKIYNG